MAGPRHIRESARVDAGLGGRRFDQVAALVFPDHSRSRLKGWIEAGCLTVDGRARGPSDRLVGGERLELDVTVEDASDWSAEDLPLTVVHEDEQLLVIDKPAGLVVHPAAGHAGGTLVNALLHHDPNLAALPRCGIVHRIDKDTTGLLVVARTLAAHTALVRQLQDKSAWREYEAVVTGLVPGDGMVEAPIGRHPVDRKRMAVVAGGKPAVTHYRVLARFRAHSHLRLRLETGRTHQIRVHMAHLHFPLVGDPVYANRVVLPAHCPERLARLLRGFPRQALHAVRLGLVHPASGDYLQWDSPLPTDLRELLLALAADAESP
jgi:23S rRNA pseudouridine1911/1915/1917 synthase